MSFEKIIGGNRYLRKLSSITYGRFMFNRFYSPKINSSNKHTITLSFDCDYKKDINAIPKLLMLLSKYAIKAVFVCAGKHIKKYPTIHKRIILEGHEICNHTYNHSDSSNGKEFSELSLIEQEKEIKKCDKVCKRILKYSPCGFRAPHFGRNYSSSIYKILNKLGYKYDSSATAIFLKTKGNPFKKNEIMEFPLMTCPNHPWSIFDTWHCLNRGLGNHSKRGEFFKLFRKIIKIGEKRKMHVGIYFDPQDVIDNNDFKLILNFLSKRKKYVKTYRELL